MKIFIDADGSPVVSITVDIAKEFDIEVMIVKNYAHQIYSDYAEVVSVDVTNDSADYYIANRVNKGDIVITQDYGLAALCLTKQAIPINQNGFIFTENNIDGMLNRRYIHGKLRNEGKKHSNPKKRKPQDDLNFEVGLVDLINQLRNN